MMITSSLRVDADELINRIRLEPAMMSISKREGGRWQVGGSRTEGVEGQLDARHAQVMQISCK